MSALDGKTVRYADDDRWSGIVLGDSALAGWINVKWTRPEPFVGSHRPEELTVIDRCTTGRDPAIEAADRAAITCGSLSFRAMTLAAREALTPLRAKHQRVQRPDGSYRCTSCRDAYGGHANWPTDTDRLIYPSEDLK